MTRRAIPLALALGATLTASGCAGERAVPSAVNVLVGPQDVDARPTQFCLDGEWQRYDDVTPPILEVSPDATITVTVDDAVAARGWSIQVFDDQLQEVIGEVDVPEDTAVFDGITTSDVVPPAFYLVVVEDKGGACGELAGAWPVGFLRAGG